jgi:hypothetical protein
MAMQTFTLTFQLCDSCLRAIKDWILNGLHWGPDEAEDASTLYWVADIWSDEDNPGWSKFPQHVCEDQSLCQCSGWHECGRCNKPYQSVDVQHFGDEGGLCHACREREAMAR